MLKSCLGYKSIQIIPVVVLIQCQLLTRDLVQTSHVLTAFFAFEYRQFAMVMSGSWKFNGLLYSLSGTEHSLASELRLTSSNESRIKYRIVVTSRFWPTRWTRQSACSSIIGFQWGSRRYTREPEVRSRLRTPISDGKPHSAHENNSPSASTSDRNENDTGGIIILKWG
jgi:hypothetical protein